MKIEADMMPLAAVVLVSVPKLRLCISVKNYGYQTLFKQYPVLLFTFCCVVLLSRIFPKGCVKGGRGPPIKVKS